MSRIGTKRRFAASDGMSAIGATTDIGQTWGLDASVENDP